MIDIDIDDDDLLMAFVLTVPDTLREEDRGLLMKHWEEQVMPLAVEAMRRFTNTLERDERGIGI